MKKIIAIGIIAMFSCMALIPIGTSTETNEEKTQDIPSHNIEKLNVRILGAMENAEFSKTSASDKIHFGVTINGDIKDKGLSFSHIFPLSLPGDMRTCYAASGEGTLTIGVFIGKINQYSDGTIGLSGRGLMVNCVVN